MAKLRVLVFCVIFVIMAVGAMADSSIYQPNTQATIFGACLNDSVPFASSANITLFYPNTSIFIANATMESFGVGEFNYSFVAPNISGAYLARLDCSNGKSDFAGFQVKNFEEEVGNLSIAIILGFTFIILTLGGLGAWLLSRPISLDNYGNLMLKFFNIKTLGVFLLIATSWLFIPYSVYLSTISSFGFFTTMYMLLLWIIPAFNMGFISTYIIFIIYYEWGVKQDRYKPK